MGVEIFPGPETTSGDANVALESRLVEVIATHFDPRGGSLYWLEQERALGIDARRDIRSLEELDVLGLMDPQALARRSVWDFVPRSLWPQRAEVVLGETGGTLGRPSRTAFSREDFALAFVRPFVASTRRVAFPRGARWAWIGPSGPHIIGKAAREVCRAMDAPDPYAIDFDPRWFRAQTPGSIGRTRYMEHVVEQALDILAVEPVDVLFSTPPVLLALGERLSAEARERIRGVHLGGMRLEPRDAARLLALYPRARCTSGYGNSLVGMCPQLEDRSLDTPRYWPHGERLVYRLVAGDAVTPRTVSYGERGRVLATRLDPSGLIVNLLERDTAVRIPPPAGGAALGFRLDGLEDPRPVETVPEGRLGIY